jgi:hypothetical protein
MVSIDLAAATRCPPHAANRASILTELAPTVFCEPISLTWYHGAVDNVVDHKTPHQIANDPMRR